MSDSHAQLVQTIRALKHAFMKAKRLPEAELRMELNWLQARLGALEAQAVELETPPAASEEPPHYFDRQMAAANDLSLQS